MSNSRRIFLGHVFTAGVAFPLLAKGRFVTAAENPWESATDPFMARAAKAHDKVMAAFDAGAAVPHKTDKWGGVTTFSRSSIMVENAERLALAVKAEVPNLKRGCDYQILTVLVDEGRNGYEIGHVYESELGVKTWTDAAGRRVCRIASRRRLA